MKRRILICIIFALILCLLTATVSAEEPSEPSVPDETVEVVELSDPVCSCSSGCYGNYINTTCPVCSVDGADLSACTGKLPNVTIAYTDGTWSSWTGSGALTLRKNCTLYVNNDFSQRNVINVNSNVRVTVQGQGHTITTPSGNYNFMASYSGSRVIINNLTLTHPSGSEGYPMLYVCGYLELNNTSINETRSHIIWVESSGTLVMNSGSLYSSAWLANIISCGKTTINGGTITSRNDAAVIAYGGTVTVNNGTITSPDCIAMLTLDGTIIVNNGTITGFSSAISSNEGDTRGKIILNGGLFKKTDPVPVTDNFEPCIWGVHVEMHGGTVSGPNTGRGIYYEEYCRITGGTITGFQSGAVVQTNHPPLILGGNVTFSNNESDVLICGFDGLVTIEDGQTTPFILGVRYPPGANSPRPITTANTAPEKQALITLAHPDLMVCYSETDTNLYIHYHSHFWQYFAQGNTVTARCTIKSMPCGYYENGVILVLDAEDMVFTGNAYDQASITNNITSITEEPPEAIVYYSGETLLDGAPTEPGIYTAAVTIGGETARDDFEIIPTYTVTYVADGVTVDTQTITRGADAVPPQIPTKENYDQTPPVWDHDGKNITTDTTITAQYTINKYTVTYIADGVTVDTQTVDYGTDAVPPQIPAKEGYDQTAPVWDHDGKNITTDTTVTAQYTINKYIVTYVADGVTVDTQTVEHGADAQPPEIPAKEGHDETAPAWDHDGTNITADTTITAQYTPNRVTVTYIANGVTVDTQTVDYGADAVPPQIPAKEGYDQTAPVWDHDGKNITADTTIIAQYTINKYTVTYVADGVTVDTQTVEHGADAQLPEIPAKVGYDKTAPTWDHDGKNITADTTITAQYTVNTYTVTFIANGVKVDVQTVEHGADATLPSIPLKADCSAIWNSYATNITEDLTVLAVYIPAPDSPDTGDTFPAGALLGLMVLSLTGLAVLLPKRRKF